MVSNEDDERYVTTTLIDQTADAAAQGQYTDIEDVEYYDGPYQFDVYDNDNPIKKSRFDRFRSWFGDMGGDFKQKLRVMRIEA